jgi:hypothetical protein
MSRFHTATLALLLVPAALAAASPQRLWDFAPYSFLRRSPQEKGAPANSQPLQVDAWALVKALSTVRFGEKGKDEPLFGPKEVSAVAGAMAQALALAQPGEDLELVSTALRSMSFFGSSLGVTARAFAVDGKLNLIVHDARLDFLYYATLPNNPGPIFNFGSRAKASATVLSAAGAELRRPDWVVLPLEQPAPAAAAPSAAGPAPAPTPAANAEERLRDLKRFLDQGLITEEEYRSAKQDLLKGFAKP